jgi:hypothetical protein
VIEHNDRVEHAWEIRERLRRPPTRTTGTSMAKPLERVEEIFAFRLGRVKVDKVPPNRLATIRANCNRVVTRETPTHGYATIATWSGAD